MDDEFFAALVKELDGAKEAIGRQMLEAYPWAFSYYEEEQCTCLLDIE